MKNPEVINNSFDMVIIIPIIAAIIASSLTSYLTLRIRKFELLQISKISAFKEVSNALTKLKRHCFGKVAELEANELSPYSAEDTSIFECRQKLAMVLDENSIFLTENARDALENLINDLSGLANAELSSNIEEDFPGIDKSYMKMAERAKEFIEMLYNDLSLKKVNKISNIKGREMKAKKGTLNKIEGVGLLFVLVSFFFQLFQNNLQSNLNESQYYRLHEKLDTMWHVVQNDYSKNHPETGVSGVINFKVLSSNWKIYSEQIQELKSWEDGIDFFSKLSIAIFVLGSLLLIIPKFIEEK